jgi:hypothetical protein
LGISIQGRAQSEYFNFGIQGGGNYPLIGSKYSGLAGLAGYSLGPFITLRTNDGINVGIPGRNKRVEILSPELSQRFTLHVAPLFTNIGFHTTESEDRYNSYYIDLATHLYFQPIAYSTDLQLYAGLRPSYLLYHESEAFADGFYKTIDDPANRNRNGRVDLALSAGVALALSEAVSIELGYVHSFTDRNQPGRVQGRPTTIELSLKLNAQGLINQFTRKETSIKERLKGYNQGSLLVMLTTPREKEVQRLEAEGQTVTAQTYLREFRVRNERIMEQFRSYYDFSKVYFFADTNAYKVAAGKYDGMFLNASFEVDSAITLDSGSVFVACICEDISAYTSRYQFGLFVYDNKINQLGKPFNVGSNLLAGSGAPADRDPVQYFRPVRVPHVNTSFERIITRLNSRLHRYRN